MDILLFSLGFCVTDITKKQISNKWVVICLLFGMLKIIFNRELLGQAVLGFVTAAVISYAIYFISKGELGMGDVKMLGCIGLYMGAYGFMEVLFLAVLLVVIFGVTLMALKKADRNTEIPFAPFLTAALMVMLGVG